MAKFNSLYTKHDYIDIILIWLSCLLPDAKASARPKRTRAMRQELANSRNLIGFKQNFNPICN